MEFAFLRFSKEVMFLEMFKDCSDHRDVLSDVVRVREYKYIVKIYTSRYFHC